MNMAWVAAIAICVLAEKALPLGRRLTQGAGVFAIGACDALLAGL
jgi:predicted metal-binding membrane protein